jgi:hypothetical protein
MCVALVDLIGRMFVIEKADADVIRERMRNTRNADLEKTTTHESTNSEATVVADNLSEKFASSAFLDKAPVAKHLSPWRIWWRLATHRKPVVLGMVTTLLWYAFMPLFPSPVNMLQAIPVIR